MQLNIFFDQSDNTVYGEIVPSETAEEINPALVREKLEAAGYKGLRVDPQAVNKLCMSVQKEEEIKLPLKVLVDATVEISVAGDKLAAFMTLTPADGGKLLTLEDVKSAISDASLHEERVDWDFVKTSVEKARAKDVRIAKAVKPIAGIDAVYTPLIECEVNRAPKIDEQGVADMLSTHSFTLVDVGDHLMRREPATEGTSGTNVIGEEIKPTPGRDDGFAKNIEGAVIAQGDEHLLIAAIKGHPLALKNGMSVDSVLHVDEVSLKTGNIRFDGSLEVKGDVSAGMYIDVTGDVVVKGAVERAFIKAGNNVVVRGGVFGDLEIQVIEEHMAAQGLVAEDLESQEEPSDDDGEDTTILHSIEAGGNIDAGFLNLVSIKSDQDIIVKQYVGNSFLEAGNRIELGQNGGKGILYGGVAIAKHAAAIAQLGNDTYIETHVQVGLLDELALRQAQLKKILKARMNEASQLESILEKLQGQDPVMLGKVSVDKTKRIENTIAVIKTTICDVQQELVDIESEMPKQKNANLLISKKMYPNSVVKVNGATRIFREELRGDTWRLKSGVVMGDNESEEE